MNWVLALFLLDHPDEAGLELLSDGSLWVLPSNRRFFSTPLVRSSRAHWVYFIRLRPRTRLDRSICAH